MTIPASQAAREAGQRVVDQIHAYLRRNGCNAPDVPITEDSTVLQAFARFEQQIRDEVGGEVDRLRKALIECGRLFATPPAAEPVGDGVREALEETAFVRVPREPTEAMIEAGDNAKPASAGSGFDDSYSYRRRAVVAIYGDMLRAAERQHG